MTLPTTYNSVFNIFPSRLTPYAQAIMGISNVDFDETVQLPIIYSAFVK